MRRANWMFGCLSICVCVVALSACGGKGSGYVTGAPVPTRTLDPWTVNDDWINDEYDEYYDDLYGDLYDPMDRFPSSRIVDPISYTQRLKLNESIDLHGNRWGDEYPDLHIPVELGELSIASGQYMLAHVNAIDLETGSGMAVLLQPNDSLPAYVIFALEGMQEGWEVSHVGLDAEWQDQWFDQYGELWIGVSRETDAGLRFDWSGRFHSTDKSRNTYLYGFDNVVAEDKVYICVLLSGETEVFLNALRVGIKTTRD